MQDEWRQQVSVALGLGAPPIPQVDKLIRRITMREATEQRLRSERNQAREAIQKLNGENQGARQLLHCFDGWQDHPAEAKELLRALSKVSHPDKYASDPVTRRLASGMQAALNYLRSEL